MGSIERFGVIGAGQMGRGIAQTAAHSGYPVALLDKTPELARKGKERIGRDLQRLVTKGRLGEDEREAVLGRIEPVTEMAAIEDVDFAVEAVTESLAVKEQVLREADSIMKWNGILASNTSSISLTKLAALTNRPEQVIGMHFMNPVPLMKLVEVVCALQTGDRTYEVTRQLAEQFGKVSVTAKDMPGFVVNRMLIPFINEACFALQEGLGTIEGFDTAARLGLNHPMGPFELADLIGLDTALYIAEVLQAEFGDDKYRPPTILRNYVAAGWLGQKAGRGFYLYDEKGEKK